MLVIGEIAEAGIEARCTELGSNCVCSERFNASGYTKQSGIDYWQPNDIGSNTKPCWVDGVTNYPIATSLTLTSAATNSGTAYTTLPSGHSVSYVLQFPMDYDSSVFYGNEENQQHTPSYKRLAARWYVNHVRNGAGEFDWAGENGCIASKLGEFGSSVLLEHSQGNLLHLRGFQGWNPAIDIGSLGPSAGGQPYRTTGKEWWENAWVRVEVVIVNTSGTGSGGEAFSSANSWQAFVYVKKMGESQEWEGVNTAAYDDFTNPSQPWDHTINYKPGGTTNKLWGDNFRSKTSGACRGTYAVSHYMMAGWTTDAGQRIGAATEVEGSGGGGSGSGGGMDVRRHEPTHLVRY